MNGPPLALLALVPMAIGPLPAEENTLTMTLCDGGSITISLGSGEGEPAGDCDQKGCHAGTCRQKQKRKNLI